MRKTTCGILDGANTTSQLSPHTPPVLVTILDTAVCSKADGNEEEEGPDRRDDKTDWEESQCNSWNNKGFSRRDGGRRGRSGLRVGVRRSSACSREDAVNERCLLG